MNYRTQNEGRWIDPFHVEQAVCKCGAPGEFDTCPWSEEMGSEEEALEQCSCCESCRGDCAMDV